LILFNIKNVGVSIHILESKGVNL